MCIRFGHIQRFDQSRHNKLAVESKRLAGRRPLLTTVSLEGLPECLCFSLLVNIVFQHSNLQIVTIEAKMMIEHLCKDAQHGCFVFVDGTLYVNIEKDGFRAGTGRLVDHHEGGRIIRKLFPEAFDRLNAAHFAICQDIRKHF